MRQTFDRYFGYFLAFLMAVMLLSVCWQVFTRYFLGSASSYTDELSRYLLIWIGMLGGAYCAGKNMHLAIDLFPNKLYGKQRTRLYLFINVLIIFFVVSVMIIGGSALVYITYTLEQTSAAMQVPLAYVYSAIPLSGVLVLIYKILDMIDLLTNKEVQHQSTNIN